MKIAASRALVRLISDEDLSAGHIIPAALDPRVGKAVPRKSHRPQKNAVWQEYKKV